MDPPVGRRLQGAAALLTLAAVLVVVALASAGAARPPGTLYYYSLHFRDGTLHSESVWALDLASGRKRKVSYKGLCCEATHELDPSGRLLATCGDGDGGLSLFDLATGRVTRQRALQGRVPMGWTPTGELVLLEQGSTHKLYAHAGRFTRLLYEADRFVVGAVPMADGTVAVMQSPGTVAACNTGRCGELEIAIVREGRVVKSIEGYSHPVIAFDGGRSLLYTQGLRSPRLHVLRLRGNGFIDEPTKIKRQFGSANDGDAVLGPDGRIALAFDGVFVLDPPTMALRRVAEGFGPLAWAPDGSIVYGGPDRKSIRVTDLRGHSHVLVRGEDVRAIAVR
jgi:hypothetical protein